MLKQYGMFVFTQGKFLVLICSTKPFGEELIPAYDPPVRQIETFLFEFEASKVVTARLLENNISCENGKIQGSCELIDSYQQVESFS